MTYIRQPTGIAWVYEVEEMVADRFTCLHTLQQNLGRADDAKLLLPQLKNPEHLEAGSAKDVGSHFMLRLASVIIDPQRGLALRRMLITAESLLWQMRVTKASAVEMRQLHSDFSSEVAEETQRLIDTFGVLEVWDKVGYLRDRYVQFLSNLAEFLDATAAWHQDHPIVFHGGAVCQQHSIDVPWELCKPLVGKKRVKLVAGRARLTCLQLLLILRDAFTKNLELAIDMLIACEIHLDEDHNVVLLELANRMADLCTEQSAIITSTSLLASEVVEESRFFPPCMKSAFDGLLRDHNCSHQTRYHLTHFLKDIGMSVDEQIKFWRSEFSKPAPSLGFQPKWDERKYPYSIRHVYGMEGGRNVKPPKECTRYQNVLANNAVPVCTFCLPARDLAASLPPAMASQDDISNVVELAAAGQPSAACNACLMSCKRSQDLPATSVTRPAQFYLKHTNLLEW